MASYTTGPRPAQSANPLRSISSIFGWVPLTTNGLVFSGVYHASLIQRKRISANEELLVAPATLPRSRGWVSPEGRVGP